MDELVPAYHLDFSAADAVIRDWDECCVMRAVLRSRPDPRCLKLASAMALALLPDLTDQHVGRWTLYTDGSHDDGWHGFGVVILAETDSGMAYFGILSGPLCPGLVEGALCEGLSNNVAEYYAGIQAMLIALALPGCSPVKVHYDNVLVAGALSGEAQGQAHPWLHFGLGLIGRLVMARRGLSWTHVKGHSGNPWNDLADTAASAAGVGEVRSLLPPPALPTDEQLAADVAHLIAIRYQLPGTLPPISGATATVTLGDPPRIPIDWAFPVRGGGEPHCGAVSCPIIVATANVLSLGGTGSSHAAGLMETCRMREMQDIVEAQRIHILAVQESRAPAAGLRSMGAYFAVATGTARNRANGTEIWISKDLPFDVGGESIYAQPRMIAVLHTEPTMLAITLTIGPMRIGILTGQAPTSGKPKRVRVWWARFLKVAIALRAATPLVMLPMDANARVGSRPHPSIGDLHPETQDAGGEGLLAVADVIGIIFPQTMRSHYAQARGHTWMSKRGRGYRNDFIGWPRACAGAELKAEVKYDLDISGGTIDHWMVKAEGTVMEQATTSLCMRRVLNYDKGLLLEPGHAESVAAALLLAPRWPRRMHISYTTILHVPLMTSLP